MKIHVCTPFALDKNLGAAYNSAFERIDDDGWACFIDHDVCFLSPKSVPMMYEYISQYPGTGIFTCLTNRIHELQPDQNYLGYPSEDFNFVNWIHRAKELESKELTVTDIRHEISGFLMLISKRVWNKIKFPEHGKSLGVDNHFSTSVLQADEKILRMDNLLVWHTYRAENIKDKSHLL